MVNLAQSPPGWVLALFVLTYLGLALGRLPGLALDRTGFAILGAVGFLAGGILSVDEAKAAIDAPTLLVLFGMMLLSAQYRLSGLYSVIGRRLAAVAEPRRLLAGTIAVAALLSAILTNDVVCFALTPLVAGSLLAARRPPLPYLLAIACASNLGSALTPIGNPQNILIAQRLHLAFLPFVAACALPVALSLGCLYLLLARRLDGGAAAVGTAPPSPPEDGDVPFSRREAAKALVLTVATLGLFLSPVPAPLTALAIAGIVLTSRRMHTRAMLAEVDWQLLALFVGLFIVVRGFELSGWTAVAGDVIARAGLDLTRPAAAVPVVSVLSNLVGNVPAVMLLLPFVGQGARIGHALAVAGTFAGNALLAGSLANLIVAEQAARLGIRLPFREHLKVGLPVTLLSLLFAVLALPWR